MSTIYDNWERLVDAVVRREQLRQLCYCPSISSSLSSDFSSTSSFTSPNPYSFGFANYKKHGLPKPSHLPLFYALFRIDNVMASRDLHKQQQQPDHLVFSNDSPFVFDADALLGAPYDNLGNEVHTFHESFVVSPRKGLTVVLKRFGNGEIPRDVLDREMKLFESVRHENLVKRRGYYVYGRHLFDIIDYSSQGSVSSMLYGKGGQNRIPLDWDTRIRIAVGAARGLAHVHKQCDGKLVHGNVKASNVFLNSKGHGCMADLILINFFNPSKPKIKAQRGYKPPEAAKMVSQASDVYMFGVFLLELLSGKSPVDTITTREYGQWAHYNARDEWTVLVFDARLLSNPTTKNEMKDFMNIGLACVVKDPDKRINMEAVVNMLELINPSHALARISVSASWSTPNKQYSHLLVFSDDSPFVFDAGTLLEVLPDNIGKEVYMFGESYVVKPRNDLTIVVRRLMIGEISHDILEEQMRAFGCIEHENVVKQRGYYLYELYCLQAFGIYDYFSQGSVYSMLKGKRGRIDQQVTLDWDARIRIAIGAARGLAHLHKQVGGKLVHGNIKASNVFLNSKGYGCLADLNLTNFFNPSEPTVTTYGGYRPPEAAKSVSQASDVYSFGVFLLELVRGKCSLNNHNYVSRAHYNVHDTGAVMAFDTELLKIPLIKNRMWSMLIIALSCVESNPDRRQTMDYIARMLERLTY